MRIKILTLRFTCAYEHVHTVRPVDLVYSFSNSIFSVMLNVIWWHDVFRNLLVVKQRHAEDSAYLL